MAHSYDPRTIALLSEIIHPPTDLQPAAVQQIHNELYGHTEFAYQNFTVQADGIKLVNEGERQDCVSLVNFLPDRIQVREELTGAHVDDFSRRVEQVIDISIEKLGIPILVAQQHVVRSLITPRHFNDSRDFLAGAACGMPADDFAVFDRPAELFGLRLVFPAVEGKNDVHAVRIESFREDPRCVWLEDVATFTTALMPNQLEGLTENVRATYDFVRDKVLTFLSRYDRKEP